MVSIQIIEEMVPIDVIPLLTVYIGILENKFPPGPSETSKKICFQGEDFNLFQIFQGERKFQLYGAK